MKHNWEYKRLSDVCFTKKEIGRASTYYGVNDEISYFDISSIDNSVNRVTSYSTTTFGDAPSRAQQVIENGDVLFSLVRPNLKNIALLNSDAANKVGTSGFCVLRGKDVLPKYVLHFVLSSQFTEYILSKASGASYPAVTEDDVRKAYIPVPTMEIQEQIVAELDKINELIEAKREQLKQLDSLAQSLFYDTFGDPVSNPKGWNRVIVKDIANVKIGPFGSLLHKEDYISGGIPLVNPIHMSAKKILADKDFTISEDKLSELKAYILRTNDVIFGRRGDIGRCALVTSDENGYLCGTGSLFVRFKTSINPIFSVWTLSQPSIVKWLIEKAKGATMLNINCSIVENVPIICPPLALQQQFAAQVEAIEAEKATVKKSIAELQTLLDSRMDYWFN